MSSIPAMPTTIVQKMIGAMIILISLMKPSPSGFIDSPVAGKKWPRRTPTMIATMTWKYSDFQSGLGAAVGAGGMAVVMVNVLVGGSVVFPGLVAFRAGI